jgi:hypothetical protein
LGDSPKALHLRLPTSSFRAEGRGRTVDGWKARPQKNDNHWLDYLVGTASMQGALLFGTVRPFAPKRERVSFKEIQPWKDR